MDGRVLRGPIGHAHGGRLALVDVGEAHHGSVPLFAALGTGHVPADDGRNQVLSRRQAIECEPTLGIGGGLALVEIEELQARVRRDPALLRRLAERAVADGVAHERRVDPERDRARGEARHVVVARHAERSAFDTTGPGDVDRQQVASRVGNRLQLCLRRREVVDAPDGGEDAEREDGADDTAGRQACDHGPFGGSVERLLGDAVVQLRRHRSEGQRARAETRAARRHAGARRIDVEPQLRAAAGGGDGDDHDGGDDRLHAGTPTTRSRRSVNARADPANAARDPSGPPNAACRCETPAGIMAAP